MTRKNSVEVMRKNSAENQKLLIFIDQQQLKRDLEIIALRKDNEEMRKLLNHAEPKTMAAGVGR